MGSEGNPKEKATFKVGFSNRHGNLAIKSSHLNHQALKKKI